MKARVTMMLLLLVPLLFVLITLWFFSTLFRDDDPTFGIVGTFFFGFFGISLSSVGVYVIRTKLRVAVVAENMGTVSFKILAQNVGCDERTASQDAAWCLSHGYLPGRVIKGDYLVKTTDGESVAPGKPAEEPKRTHAVKCSYCGASYTFTGDVGECPYCGNSCQFDPDKSK